MGTIAYNVKFLGSNEEVMSEVDLKLKELNESLSTYIPDSEISKLNRDSEHSFSTDYFYPVLEKSKEIFEITSGTFDPSVGPLVEAWGFGPNKTIPDLSRESIDSLKGMTGFAEVKFDKEQVSIPKGFKLDFGAIAKGYAVDIVAQVLENYDISNYMIEIGGEVRAKGKNDKGKTWSLGIEDPMVEKEERKIIAVAKLKDRSMATSGNYRNYYQKDGKIFAHILDPRTGYNASHRLLSVSVFAEDCMTADAFATAFMVLGKDESLKIVEENSDLDAVFIFVDDDENLANLVSDGMKPFVKFVN